MQSQGERIGLLHDVLGWTNEELSRRTGIPAPVLSMYVHARRQSITTIDMWRIARETGVTTDWLIYGDPRYLSAEMRTLLYQTPPEDTQ
jgi:transcriptional regulator with XRE-family HTH domain